MIAGPVRVRGILPRTAPIQRLSSARSGILAGQVCLREPETLLIGASARVLGARNSMREPLHSPGSRRAPLATVAEERS